MASACLKRSFSNPSETSHDFPEGNPIHALGDSISFGRYMSENLAWEKWSTFSHNRYLEEAEKSSKPGSVAKMKAYFEAHYKKVGVKKQGVLGQARDDSCYVEPEIQDTHNVEPVSSLISSSTSNSPAPNPIMALPHSNEIRRSFSSPALHAKTALLNSNSIEDELDRKLTPSVEPLPSVIVSFGDASPKTNESGNEEASIVESSFNVDCKECPLEVQVHQVDDAEVKGIISENYAEIAVVQSKDTVESGNIPIVPEQEVTVEKEAKDKSDLKNTQKLADSSLKSSKKSNVSKLSSSLARLATPGRPKKEGDGTPKNNKSTRESVEKKKSMSKLFQMSLDVNSSDKLMNKPSTVSHDKLSSSLSRLATPVRPKKEGVATPRNHKSTRESVEQKKPISKSVQMPIDVDSDDKLVKKPKGNVFTPLGKIVRKGFAQTPAPSTCRASVNSVSRHPSATPQSETRRSKIALEKSFSRNRTDQSMQSPAVGIALEKSFARNRTDQKLQSPALGNMKSPAQSPITFSPFNFRTEERAAKRREFFERRLEKEAEKLQLLEKPKMKSNADSRKLSQSVNFSNAALNSRREILSDKTKIPSALPQPPKCESKPSSNLVRGKCSQPSWSTVSSKLASGNNKSIAVTLPTKKRQENDSPNIL